MAANFKPKIFGKVSMRLRLSPDWPTALKTKRNNTKLKTAERHHGCFASLLSINLKHKQGHCLLASPSFNETVSEKT